MKPVMQVVIPRSDVMRSVLTRSVRRVGHENLTHPVVRCTSALKVHVWAALGARGFGE